VRVSRHRARVFLLFEGGGLAWERVNGGLKVWWPETSYLEKWLSVAENLDFAWKSGRMVWLSSLACNLNFSHESFMIFLQSLYAVLLAEHMGVVLGESSKRTLGKVISVGRRHRGIR